MYIKILIILYFKRNCPRVVFLLNLIHNNNGNLLLFANLEPIIGPD